jgi:adenine-specific DNA-methyltransferase
MPTLNWMGKKAVESHLQQVPFHLLKEIPALCVGKPGSGNLLVEGDNLLALKALLPYYGGEIKCIYIDPPYNTGNENWTYNDNVNSPEMRDWLGKVVGGENEDLTRHDKWLCMMYPRLALLHRFLREDGVIFISIDDNELANLLLLANDVFGEQNHLATLVWEKGKKGDSRFFSETHEYIVAFARSKSKLVELRTKWKRRKQGVDQVFEQYQHLRDLLGGQHALIRSEMLKWYRSLPKNDPAKSHKHYSWSDNRGLYFAADFAGPDDGRKNRPRYDIIHPVTGKSCAKPSTGWRWEEERTKGALAEDPPRIHFGPDETTIPCRKSYLIDVSQEPFPTVFYKDGRAATLQVEQVLGKGKFAFPKDVEVLADLIGMVTKESDLILDSFAGSGSTAHAVLKLNKEDRHSNRRFILIELDVDIARQLTAERVRQVIGGVRGLPALGGGFRFATLGEPLFDERGRIRDEVSFSDLARHAFFMETGEPLPRDVKNETPLIGKSRGTAVYLLYNGILKDKSPNGGNVLTTSTLGHLPKHDGPKVVYGTACRLGSDRLRRENIVFKQLPYKLRVGVL